MTRVGWLADVAAYAGGAEFTESEQRAAAPEGIEIVMCPPDDINWSCDVYVVHNCVTYTVEDLAVIKARRAVRYWNDVGSWLQPGVRELLDKHATPVCCSPLQAQYMGLLAAAIIPPPVNLERFKEAALSVNGNRRGAVCVGSWRNIGKAPHRAAEWAVAEGRGIDFYGEGPYAPESSRPVSYEDMPQLLAGYETFTFLPTVIEPFGRAVVEAWAAGCELVVNDLVGAKWWITENPDGLESASEDFWRLVLR